MELLITLWLQWISCSLLWFSYLNLLNCWSIIYSHFSMNINDGWRTNKHKKHWLIKCDYLLDYRCFYWTYRCLWASWLLRNWKQVSKAEKILFSCRSCTIMRCCIEARILGCVIRKTQQFLSAMEQQGEGSKAKRVNSGTCAMTLS